VANLQAISQSDQMVSPPADGRALNLLSATSLSTYYGWTVLRIDRQARWLKKLAERYTGDVQGAEAASELPCGSR
jgi:hypothetical protein